MSITTTSVHCWEDTDSELTLPNARSRILPTSLTIENDNVENAWTKTMRFLQTIFLSIEDVFRLKSVTKFFKKIQ